MVSRQFTLDRVLIPESSNLHPTTPMASGELVKHSSRMRESALFDQILVIVYRLHDNITNSIP